MKRTVGFAFKGIFMTNLEELTFLIGIYLFCV